MYPLLNVLKTGLNKPNAYALVLFLILYLILIFSFISNPPSKNCYYSHCEYLTVITALERKSWPEFSKRV